MHLLRIKYKFAPILQEGQDTVASGSRGPETRLPNATVNKEDHIDFDCTCRYHS